MLASAETIAELGKLITKHQLSNIIVDPVMVSTSGAELLPRDAVSHLSKDVLPHTTLLTPNVPEARLLLEQNGKHVPDVKSVADLEELAAQLKQLGPKWVLVKGGHLPLNKDTLEAASSDQKDQVVVNVLVGDVGFKRIIAPFQDSSSTHGTGCSLACKPTFLLFIYSSSPSFFLSLPLSFLRLVELRY